MCLIGILSDVHQLFQEKNLIECSGLKISLIKCDPLGVAGFRKWKCGFFLNINFFFPPLWCSLNKCLSRRMRSTNRMVGLKRRKTAFLWTCTSFKLHADNPLILLLLSLCPAFICLSFFCQNGPEAWCLMLDVCWFFLLLFYFHVIVRHREQKVNNKVLVVFEVFFFFSI